MKLRADPPPALSSQLIGSVFALLWRRGSDWPSALAAVNSALGLVRPSAFIPQDPGGLGSRRCCSFVSAGLALAAAAFGSPRATSRTPRPRLLGPLLELQRVLAGLIGRGRGGVSGSLQPARRVQWFVTKNSGPGFPWRFYFRLPSWPSAFMRQGTALQYSPYLPPTICP